MVSLLGRHALRVVVLRWWLLLLLVAVQKQALSWAAATDTKLGETIGENASATSHLVAALQ
jgi:hypothetical protein